MRATSKYTTPIWRGWVRGLIRMTPAGQAERQWTMSSGTPAPTEVVTNCGRAVLDCHRVPSGTRRATLPRLAAATSRCSARATDTVRHGREPDCTHVGNGRTARFG